MSVIAFLRKGYQREELASHSIDGSTVVLFGEKGT